MIALTCYIAVNSAWSNKENINLYSVACCYSFKIFEQFSSPVGRLKVVRKCHTFAQCLLLAHHLQFLAALNNQLVVVLWCLGWGVIGHEKPEKMGMRLAAQVGLKGRF